MTKPVFTAPYYDVVFKAIFGQEGNKEPLMSLLSSIMDLPLDFFEDLMLLNSELNSELLGEKVSRLDLRIRLKDKTEIDVEVQIFGHLGYKERVLYYWSKMYGASLAKGEPHVRLKKCVIINIIYFELSKSPNMHSKYQILEALNHEKFTDHLEIHVLELSKLNAYNRTIENNLLIDWAEFLSLRNEEELMTLKDRKDLPEAVINAIEEFERIKDNPDLQWEALNKQIAIYDYIHGMEDAKAQGIAEGKAEGIAEGIELVAKKLINQGMDFEAISDVTGLSIEEIKRL